jgi:hypothetical protein
MSALALEALKLSQAGDIDGALALLRAARENGPLDENALSLFFTIARGRVDVDDLIAICGEALAKATRPLQKSSWHVRRAHLHIEAGHKKDAVADLMAVLRLRASDDHVSDAQRALLDAAALDKKPQVH